MTCIKFWLDDFYEAITNLRSIIPRANQCINEKLNCLAFFSVLFTLFLWAMNVPYYWAFGIFGVLASVLLKMLFFDKDLGNMTVDDYQRINMKDLEKYLPDEGYDTGDYAYRTSGTGTLKDEHDYSDGIHYISTTNYMMDKNDGTWEGMKESVANDVLKSTRPLVVPLSQRLGDICIV
jgi:hypothetical protein